MITKATYAGSSNTMCLVEPSMSIVPADDPQVTEWVDAGNTIFPYVAAPEAPPSQKQIRDDALQALTYDFGDGRVMQTRPQDETNIRVAIDLMVRENISTKLWTMVDNVKYPVTDIELETAYHAGQLAASAIWDNYTPE